MNDRTDDRKATVTGLVGFGLDGTDGQRRITRSEEFLLLGGSAETHERMQETAIKFGEALEKRGKRLQDVEPQEALDLLRDANS